LLIHKGEIDVLEGAKQGLKVYSIIVLLIIAFVNFKKCRFGSACATAALIPTIIYLCNI
jgi:hypothetical protein